MNKKIITALIILMGISILGIIIVQGIWMRNAVKVKNEQFDRSVSEALSQTVGRMETLHDVMVINSLAFPDSDFRYSRRVPMPPPRWSIAPGMKIVRRNDRIRKGNGRTEIQVEWQHDSVQRIEYQYIDKALHSKTDTSGSHSSQEVIVIVDDSVKRYDQVLKRGMVMLDSMTIALDTLRNEESQLSRKVHVRTTGLRNLAERAVTEITHLDNPIIDRKELEQVLQEELNSHNIPISYEYGVFRDSTLLMGSEGPDTVALRTTPFQTGLFPNNIFRRNVSLNLSFPEREKFIYKSISWLLGISLFFSIFILLAFAFSVFLILRQKKISEMKSDFINNMTHEFKTPIATISVASDSILSEKVIGDRGKVEYFASMIKKENQRMNRQVEDILTIARLEKKEIDFRWEKVDLHEIISEVCDVIGVQVEQRGGKILSLLEAISPVVRADRQHLSNVVFNLLDNANKFSPEKPYITVKTENHGSGIRFSVTDKGAGMSHQVQSKIFERFYRQSSGNVHNVKGFGLGLSYVKAVVEAHGGIVSVESEPGKGSTFEVIIPNG